MPRPSSSDPRRRRSGAPPGGARGSGPAGGRGKAGGDARRGQAGSGSGRARAGSGDERASDRDSRAPSARPAGRSAGAGGRGGRPDRTGRPGDDDRRSASGEERRRGGPPARGSGSRGSGRPGGRPPRGETSEPSETPWARRAAKRAADDDKAQRAGWGGVARRGAGRLRDEGQGSGASAAFRAAADQPAWEPEVWIDEGAVRDEASGAVDRARKGRRAASPVDEGALEPDPSLRRAVSGPRLERFEERLKDASRAFRRERYEEARRILRPLAEAAPTAETVRELLGLTYYRLGRWKQAVAELEAFADLAASTEQHPVLADCYRALGRHGKVEELWEDLKRASPAAALVAEGRIVYAGSLADQGRLQDAIAVLEASKPAKRPQEHHLRVTYALADLYERAGDVPQARRLFGVVAATDPDLGDVAARLRALR